MVRRSCVVLLAAAALSAPPADGKKGLELLYRLPPSRQKPEQVAKIVRGRLERLGVEAAVELTERRALSVKLRDPAQAKRVKRVVAKPGKIEFRITVENDDEGFDRAWELFRAARKKGVAVGKACRVELEGKAYRWCRISDGVRKERTARDAGGEHWMLVELDEYDVSNGDLTSISTYRDARGLSTDHFAIGFVVEKAARDRMHALTDREDRYMAVIIDGRVLIAPRLNTALRANGEITGGFTKERAEELAATLQSPPLEAPPALASETPVELTPGK